MQRFLTVICLALVLAAAAARLSPDLVAQAKARPDLVLNGVWLTLLAAFLVSRHRGRARDLVVQAGAWVVLGVLLVGGYAYRDQVEAAGRHILAELSPSTPEVTGQREVTLRAAGDGHFHVDARVNGAPVRMLLDTGASAVALTPEAAEHAGIDLDKLDYDIPVQTANGTDRVALARIRELAVGTIVLRDVQAYVSRPGRLPEPLLGMSFLDRLGGFEKSGRKLILRQ
jgi:aspartyl protease family protein